MNEETGLPFIKRRCKACGYTFLEQHYFSDFDYGMRDDLFCDRCGKKAAVNCFRDPAWDLLTTKLKLEFGLARDKHIKDDKLIALFEKWFEESCDKCPCGGAFHFLKSPGYQCPRCNVDALEEVERGVSEGKIEIPWVTHNDWFEKHPQSDAKPA